MSTLRWIGIVSGGVGVLGLGGGVVFTLLAGSALSDQRSACSSPTVCPNHVQALSDHQTFTTDATIGTAGLVAGGVLLAAGAVMFLAGGTRTESGAATGVLLLPTLAPGGAGATVQGSF
jgi:hypothetical protein